MSSRLLGFIAAAILMTTSTLALAADEVSDLAWLQGSWKATTSDAVYECSFSSTGGGMIVGAAKLTSADGTKLVFYEFDQIQKTSDGLQLQPFPYGKAGVIFPVTVNSDRKVVFENLKNGFPARITYAMNENAQLVVRVQGKKNNSEIDESYAMDKN